MRDEAQVVVHLEGQVEVHMSASSGTSRGTIQVGASRVRLTIGERERERERRRREVANGLWIKLSACSRESMGVECE